MAINLSASMVKSVLLQVIGDASDAYRTLEEVTAAAKDLHPEMTIAIDRAKAFAEMTLLKNELSASLSEDPVKIPVEPDFAPFRAELDKAAQDFLANAPGAEYGNGGLGQTFEKVAERSLLQRLLGRGGGGSGAISGALFGTGGAGVGGGIPVVGSAISAITGFGAVGWSGLLVAVMGLVNAVGSLAVGLTAAGLGVASFAALAYPTFTNISGAVTQVNADMAALQGAHGIAGVITQAQAQAAAAAKLKDDYAAMDPLQAKIVKGIVAIQAQFETMAAAFAPKVEKIVADLVPIAERLLPDIGKFANAAAPAIDTLVRNFGRFTESPGFKDFINQLVRLTPGVILALGEGIGKLVIAVGKLLEVFTHGKNAVNVITGIFTALTDLINGLTIFITVWNRIWDGAVRTIARFNDDVLVFIARLPSEMVGYLSRLPRDFEIIGQDAVLGFIKGLEEVPIVGPIVSFGADVVSLLRRATGSHSPSTLAAEVGKDFAAGFYLGLGSTPGGVGVNIRGVGGGGSQITLVVQADGSAESQYVAHLIKSYVTAFGGGGANSVQRALGKVA